jgi:bifunctional DNase/RNase
MDSNQSLDKRWITLAIIGLWFATLTCSQAGTAVKDTLAEESDGERLIKVSVYRLSVDPASQQPVVTLVDPDETRAFPIWIGLAEARAIHSELQGLEHFRPLTHDLLARIIDSVNGTIHHIVITHIKDNVFFATLVLKKNGTLIEIDARPSDSIVLALKFKAPIYISTALFEKMSIPMEVPQDIGGDYGLNLQALTPELAKYLSLESSRGVMVSAVNPGSQAEKDGIQPGDIFVEISGLPITDLKAASDLIGKGKGPLEAKIARGKRILKITLNLE